jgi:CheY-like chemotaxis protein
MKDLDNLIALSDTPVAAPASDQPSAIDSLGKNVLIVDDDPDTSWLLADLLVTAGYEVQTAESAEGAMRALYSFTPDAVLMDVRLPGMNGLKLVRLIKLTTPKKVPIIAVSAVMAISPNLLTTAPLPRL